VKEKKKRKASKSPKMKRKGGKKERRNPKDFGKKNPHMASRGKTSFNNGKGEKMEAPPRNEFWDTQEKTCLR